MTCLTFITRSAATTTLLLALMTPHADAQTEVSTQAPDFKDTPSGTYQLDPNHTSITFKINHLGFSHYTGRFDKMDATLKFDSANPENSALDVTIIPNSIDTNNAKLEEELRGENFFNVIKFPTMTFKATKIVRTGPTTGTITGDFTMLGVTHSVTLNTTLVGAGIMPMIKKTRYWL